MKKLIVLIGILVSGLSAKTQIIPPLGVASSYTLTAGQSTNFYDPSGPGGATCTTGLVATGSYTNCACFTTITICAAPGEFLLASFNEFSMWNTTSGWDWMKIYDGNSTAAPILYDNSSTGPDNPFGDCGIGSTVLDFCASGRCLTFEFWATSVVNRAGWDATVSSTGSGCVLPIELEWFTGTSKEDYNLLSWVTTTEINNEYFTIEYSRDAINWIFLETIDGGGNTNTPNMYQYADYDYEPGTNYYRLSQTDFDGSIEVFEIIAILNKRSQVEITITYDTLGQVINNPDTYIGMIVYRYNNGFWYKVVRLR